MEKISSQKGAYLVRVALALLFAMVVLPTNLKAIAILFFAVTVLVQVIQNGWYFDKRFFITNGLLYVAIACTFFYSSNQDYGQRKLLQMASLIVFPFLFATFSKGSQEHAFKDLKLYLCIYLLGVFVFNVVPFLYFWKIQYSFMELMEHFITLIRTRMGKWSIHPIYMSMHCSMAVLFSFYILKGMQSRLKIAAIIGIDITLILFLLLYAKKGPLIALLVVFSLFVVFQRNQKLLVPYLIAVISLITLTVLIPNTRNKFVELLTIENLDRGQITSSNIRYTIYDTAQKLIKEAPLAGYGIGDYNDELRLQYAQEGNELLVKGKYNSHNQYVSYLLVGGGALLLIFLFLMGINLVYAIRFNNQLLILMLIFYGIVMLTENVLERESGILYFAFFLNFFGTKSLYTTIE